MARLQWLSAMTRPRLLVPERHEADDLVHEYFRNTLCCSYGEERSYNNATEKVGSPCKAVGSPRLNRSTGLIGRRADHVEAILESAAQDSDRRENLHSMFPIRRRKASQGYGSAPATEAPTLGRCRYSWPHAGNPGGRGGESGSTVVYFCLCGGARG